jgi:3-dehydroquinate dehydratase I
MILKPQMVAVLGKDAEEGILVAGDSDMVEVRLDLISTDPLETIKAIRKATTKPIIATNRLKTEGGKFEGNERERCELLIRASMYADYVDIELRAELRDELIRRVHKPVIISYHDFQGMPDRVEMRSILRNMKEAGAAIAKIAVTPSRLKDNLQILEFLLETDMPLCVIAMGKLGRHLRAVAPLYGSVLTYGYVFEATAPGQMSIKELKEAMRLLDPGVLGFKQAQFA